MQNNGTAKKVTGTAEEIQSPHPPDEVYIQNAGMVLAWPFFSVLFNRVKFTDESGFISETHAFRAVCLLQYMATGLEQYYESELSLNKIICGIEISETVPQSIMLTEEEKAMADSLLENLINQWPILSNTSNAGLRNSFLVRQGKLLTMENAYSLVVEQKGYDMLLDHLHWSVGTIKLSWMKKTLFVKWQ